nr:pyridine nucleotide-disulfide oxidoreductase [Acidimicrobiia bacterium]
TEARAREQGLGVKVVDYAIEDVAGATIEGEGVAGTATLVVDEGRRVVVGATFTGPAVGEMLHAATVAIVGQVTVDDLWHAVPSYPTVSEVWLRLLETYGL